MPFTLTSARLAVAAILAASLLYGCAGPTGPSAAIEEPVQLAPWDGPRPAIKPRGLAFRSEADKARGFEKMGPPPPGYIRITGEPDPEWDASRGQYEARASPFTWTFLGPKPESSEYWSYENSAGGRVVSIAPHPTDPNIVYIASASGGIWKTTNGGTLWTPLTDELSTLNHGVVTIDPSATNTIYVGTGEYTQGSAGDGVFKSLDAGATWARVATAAQVGTTCSGLAVSPTTPATIHFTGRNGYCRTTNGGTTWTTPISGTCSALRVHPTNGQILYIAKRGTGIYKSTNAGGGFSLLAGGLPAGGTFDRIVMDICKVNPLVLYAAFINGSNMAGTYKTIDGGTTWTLLPNTPNFCVPQCWYDAYIGVDPANQNIVMCGGVDPRYQTAGVIRSTNGGTSWTEVSAGGNGLHPDHHAIAWGPTGIVWEGNDGGINKSTNGTTWTNVNATLAATQMYHVIVHPTSEQRILAGTQDNGTPERTSNSFTWPQLQTGDGGFSVFDPTNTTRRYTTYVYLAITRWNSGTGAGIDGPWDADSTNWISPFVIDPNASATLVAGTERVWRTANATSSPPTWTAISGFDVGGGGVLNAVAVAKGASGTIYVGNTAGDVWVSTNATAVTPTWANRSTGLPNGQISTIIISPTAPATALVAYYNSTGGRIWRTDNTGVSWRSVTGTLPSGVAARGLAVDFNYTPPVTYIGGGAGVYVSFNEGATWIKDDATFPNVNIGALHIDTRTRTLAVGTYGRGVWRTALAAPPPCIADYNQDGGIDGQDIEAFFNDWTAGNTNADVNEDGGVDGQDVEAFFIAWQTGGC